MKKLVCFAVIFLGLSAMVMAQDFPRGEVFLGYSLVDVHNPAFVFGSSPQVGVTYNGLALSAVVNGNKWLSFVADLGGYYRSGDAPKVSVQDYSGAPPRGSIQDSYHIYTFLFGPRFSVRASNRVTPFIQALFGDARVTPGANHWNYENDFAAAVGGGVDIKVYKNFSVRPVQLEYLAIKSGQPLRDNLRYTAGISWNFGSVSK